LYFKSFGIFTQNHLLEFENDIVQSLEILRQGGLILYPTDTIWGIGCDATNPEAVKKIFALKQRAETKSLIVLMADERDVLKYTSQPDLQVFDYLHTIQKPTTVIYEGPVGLADNLTGADGTVPNRYLSGFAVDPKNADHVYLAVNGFSRHWTEGPGAGVGHVFESTDGGTTWKDISANLPDVPTDSLLALPGGGLALATDLGVVYRAPHQTSWKRVGQLPAVAVLQLKAGSDGRIYAATHGRGIYSFPIKKLR